MALSHSPRIVTDELVLCLDAANKKSYSGSGTVWNDLSGNGHHGTLINGPTYSSDNGGSLVFDGTNDHIRSSNFSSLLDYQQSGTVDVWFRFLSAPSGNYAGIWCFVANSNDRIIWLETSTVAANLVRYVWRLSSGALGAINTNIFPTINRDSNNIVCTYETVTSNVTFKVYLNGVLHGETTVSGVLTNTSIALNSFLTIGRNNISASGVNAKINRILIYNKILHVDEIQQNYNALRGRFGL